MRKGAVTRSHYKDDQREGADHHRSMKPHNSSFSYLTPPLAAVAVTPIGFQDRSMGM
jgi:hypothetical protein